MNRFASLALALTLSATTLSLPSFAQAATADDPSARLMIVDGNTEQVIYDDGVDDLFCVTRLHRWRDENGYRHHHRSMRCR